MVASDRYAGMITDVATTASDMKGRVHSPDMVRRASVDTSVRPLDTARDARRVPFFVVGCPRSGTRLLRLMLNAHPRLAVPRESHFVVGLAPRFPWSRLPSIDDVIGFYRFHYWNIDESLLRRRVAEARPDDYAGLVEAIFEAYATAHGKERWGDKTPDHVDHMDLIDRLFPGARFIHLIRDGRFVAASLSEVEEWGPPSAVSGAFWWKAKLKRGRRGGRRFPDRYMEVRLEDLVADPEGQLRRICAFIGEDYSASMLDYAEVARSEYSDPEDEAATLSGPPARTRSDWTTGLSPSERRAVAAVCGPTQEELGYETTRRTPSGLAIAYAMRARDLVLIAGKQLAVRLRVRQPDQ
jgi:Sulfotransferase family